ncbi:excinuclease ABC subunit UvrA [bacterium NHP-B]|nr:excinuclease ABC subunit UvrA [bacterium NHP-B]
MTLIRIRGAREHNLKNISLDLPRDQLIVITGPSGSGKSSLAFDTLYAEGQRRYVESLSSYARQFLDVMKKPDVDNIDGLSPAIAIEQKTTSKNPRSTVATVTEIYDYLRLLYARVGIPVSPATGKPIQAQTVSEMVDQTLALPFGRLYIFAPLIRGRKGEFRKEFVDLQKQGFTRVWIDGTLYELDNLPLLDKKKTHTIHVLVDRLKHAQDSAIKTRLAEAFEMALRISPDELVWVQHLDAPKEMLFSARFACPESGFTIEKLEPRLFSFNSPSGACPTCDGLGVCMEFDLDKIIPDPTLSLEDGAIAPWAGGFFFYYLQILRALAKHYDFSLRTAFQDLPQQVKDVLLYGSGKTAIPMDIRDEKRTYRSHKPFEGIIPMMTRRQKEKEDGDDVGRWHKSQACPACQGQRLKPEALCVQIHGQSIGAITQRSILDAHAWFNVLLPHLTPKQQHIAERIVKEISDRLQFLVHVGVGYLHLSRVAGSLSGGEAQRIRLASQIGAGLMGVLYVLDEPSIGLHQRDNARLIETLQHLKNLGNTIVVVEHDEDTMRACDYLVDMGPAAGSHGGDIVAQGPLAKILAHPSSLTGAYLSGKKAIAVPTQRRAPDRGKMLSLQGATINNLNHISVDIPLGLFVCATGVSGSGKSSLVIETLYPALARALNRAQLEPGPYTALEGLQHLDKVIDIDQSPIGRTPRSNPATYTGLFSPIRDWFASLPAAKARGFTPGRFSFNVRGGRCEACSGDGVTRVEMHFLPDIYVTCDVCEGKRYNRETLAITFKGKSIADVLAMTVDDAFSFFENMPSIRHKLRMLQDVGLGYIHVGQRATTLSGGEAQRVKLAKELAKKSTGKTFYILDEPTTGLHMDDIKKLLDVLHTLVNQGNTVLVIEHNIDVIKTADWVIDIGPEGGTGGGQLVACGTPEDIANVPQSHTGHFLTFLLSDKSMS